MVHKRERKTREEICEEILDGRDTNPSLSNTINPSLSNTIKIYSDETREEIIALLRNVAEMKDHEILSEDLERGLNEVEAVVYHYRKSERFIRSIPIDQYIKDKFRELRKPLRKVLVVLEHGQMAHLNEHLPTLLPQIQMLTAIVESEVRDKRGNPGNPLHREMFERILKVWVELTGALPTSSKNDPRAGDTHKFLRKILEPTDFDFPDEAIQYEIRAYRIDLGREKPK